jgi:ATP/maltotriose-dependent transcriptional regulator MalT
MTAARSRDSRPFASGGSQAGGATRHILRRAYLEERLDEAFARRLVLLIADAGFGKTTVLASWTRDVSTAWYTLGKNDLSLIHLYRGLRDALIAAVPSLGDGLLELGDPGSASDAEQLAGAETVAARMCELLEQELPHDLVLALDDVHELGEAPAPARFLETLCRQAPDTLHLVLCSRSGPPFSIERLRGQGRVVEPDASELAFTREEVANLLRAALDEDDVELATGLHQATAGWPAAVRLAIDVLAASSAAGRPAAVAKIGRSGGAVFSYIAGEVFDRESADVREFIQCAAQFDRFTVALMDRVGVGRTEEWVSALARRGLLLSSPAADGWFELHLLVRDFAVQRWPLTDVELKDLHRRAATWFEDCGLLREALASMQIVGDERAVAALLGRRPMLSREAPDALIAAAEKLARPLRSAAIERVLGEAYFAKDDLTSALLCFQRAAAQSRNLDPTLAWWIASMHYNRGDFDAMTRTYERVELTGAGSPEETRVLTSWSHAHALRGEIRAAQLLAERALDEAEASGDDTALALAYHAKGLISTEEGDRRQAIAHYRDELRFATRAQDALQLIRSNNNLANLLVSEGHCDDALEAVQAAIRLAELPGNRAVLPYALDTRGRANFGLGRLEEARADFESAIRIHTERASHFAADPLVGLGDVHRERGDLALARIAYADAVSLAERSGLTRALRAALAGLARTMVDDLDASRHLLERALSLGEGEWWEEVLLSAGWVSIAAGDHEDALRQAQRLQTARAPGPSVLAQSYELSAFAAPSPNLALLEQAQSIWRSIRNPIGEARVELALALLASEAGDQPRIDQAELRLRRLGIRAEAVAAGLLAALPPRRPAEVELRTLGGFAVLRHGEPVPHDAWQSKRARELVKLLVARRGRPVSREFVMESLWPGGQPEQISGRLSVALSTARSVLDPEKRFDSQRYLNSDRDTIALDQAHVSVDVEMFLAEATAALGAVRDDEPGAVDRLEYAEALHGGEFLEEDPYSDWALPLREEARAVYADVLRALERHAERAGDLDGAARYLLRILERDPFDERSHLALVSLLRRGGRHGDARHAYGTYATRMEEIAVEPAPYPTPEQSPAR